MRRHPSLIPLSRFHRSVLFLALLAKKNGPDLKGYPKDLPGKRDYALNFYQKKLRPHFALEATQLFPLAESISPVLAQMVQELREERALLARYFERLEAVEDFQLLHEIGDALEKHIRKEERQFFQLLQAEWGEQHWQQLNFEHA